MVFSMTVTQEFRHVVVLLAVVRVEATGPPRHCEDLSGCKREAYAITLMCSPSWLGCKCLAGLTGDSNSRMAAPCALTYHGFGWQGRTIVPTGSNHFHVEMCMSSQSSLMRQPMGEGQVQRPNSHSQFGRLNPKRSTHYFPNLQAPLSQ